MAEKCYFNECDGSGRIRLDENTDEWCRCFKVKTIGRKLGPELNAEPKRLLESPLYPGYATPEVIDRTRQNILVRGTWADIRPHLRFALFCRFATVRNFQFSFRIVTDQSLLQVWLGKDSYQQRSKRDRDFVTTYNSLKDVIGSDTNLVIIRLNHLGHKNVAAPGVLLEALLLRATFSKPTWIIEETDRARWRYYLREDVASYISYQYRTVTIENDGTPPRSPALEEEDEEEPGFGSAADSDSVSASETSATSVGGFPETPAFEAPPIPDSTEDILDTPGLKDSKRNGYGKKGRRGNLQ